jgi:hypothetical protein
MPPKKLIISIQNIQNEPVTLTDAKEWLQMSPDQTDWDNLIETLISASRETTESNSGQLLTVREVTISNNSKTDRIYPIGPWVSDVTTDLTETTNYSYLAGFSNYPIRLENSYLAKGCNGICLPTKCSFFGSLSSSEFINYKRV